MLSEKCWKPLAIPGTFVPLPYTAPFYQSFEMPTLKRILCHDTAESFVGIKLRKPSHDGLPALSLHIFS